MRRWVGAAVIAGCLVALLAACFGPVFWSGKQFAYRDFAHYYYPLYERVQHEWDAGRWPLWEPEENGGMPLLGNPTAAVLYPGKLIYAALPYPWAARVYVLAHTLLAFAGMFALLRHWRVGGTGCAIAALSYAFGAPILFQYCNIIFLVGAGWLPWGFRAVDRLVREGRRWALVELAFILALQTLGGDPQAAYLTVICGAAYAVGLAGLGGWFLRGPKWLLVLGALFTASVWTAVLFALASGLRRGCWLARSLAALETTLKQAVPELTWRPSLHGMFMLAWAIGGLFFLRYWVRKRGSFILGRRLFCLVGAGALALGLAGAQLLPVLEYTRRSLRSLAAESPHEIYPFSLEPVRAVELLWPNVFGDYFRDNCNWLNMLPPLHAPTSWVPSLYLGGLALLLALGAAGFRGGPPWRAWLTAIALLSFVASLGEFGSPLFWARSTSAGAKELGPRDPPQGQPLRVDGSLRDGDGGFYWFLATALPEFGSFRYPSKLMTLTTLALCALAGIGWDRLAAGRSRRTVAIAAVLLVLSLALLAGVVIEREHIVEAMKNHPEAKMRTLFGPFNVRGALREILRASAQGTLLCACVIGLAVLVRFRPRGAALLALLVLTADLALANARLVITAPQSEFDAEPELVRQIREAERKDPSDGPFRIHRMSVWHPLDWDTRHSDERMKELLHWEHDTLQHKYAIMYGLSYVLSQGVTELYDYWWFFGPFQRRLHPAGAHALNGKLGQEIVYYPRRGFDMWGTRYFILPIVSAGWNEEFRGWASFRFDTEMIAPVLPQGDEAASRKQAQDWAMRHDWQLMRNKNVYPRAWVVHRGSVKEPIEGMKKDDRQLLMQEMLFQNDVFWQDPEKPVYDLHTFAWLESRDVDRLKPYLAGGRAGDNEKVTVTRYEPQRVELRAELKRPGLVILADVDYPGWHLTIDSKPAPIIRTNRLMRGAAVDGGTHTLVYTYWPSSFLAGAWLTLASALVLAMLAAWAARQRGQNPWPGHDDLDEPPYERPTDDSLEPAGVPVEAGGDWTAGHTEPPG